MVTPTPSIWLIARTMEREVPGDADAGNRFLSEPSNPGQVDQEIERLKHHCHQHVAGRLQQMAREGAGREGLAWIPALYARAPAVRPLEETGGGTP